MTVNIHTTYTDAYLQEVLDTVNTIALVGASPKPERDSYEVMAFLQKHNYRIIPVNPVIAGQTLLGETVYASLGDIPCEIDMVEIFRNSEAAGEICREAVTIHPKVIWMQLGVINHEAAEFAEAQGITVIMDRCPKQQIQKQLTT